MRSSKWFAVLGFMALALVSRAEAQEPDVRNIPPFVMLVVDTSGSMEDLPACTCISDPDDCTNCAPNCALANVAGEAPKSSGGKELKKNKWAVTLEALTGKFNDFQCNELARTTANGATYDLDYTIPYHQPWKCAIGQKCDYPGGTTQTQNGILDSYSDTLQFGLMTFDGQNSYKGASDLVNASTFDDALSEGMAGMWSYAGKKSFRYPGCPEEYYMDTGARSEDATEGGLISIDTPVCTTPPCDMQTINDAIQTALLKTRPYLGTPIASSLDDLYYHLQTDMVDTYKSCRRRYGILITDGVPDTDKREYGCDCGDENPMKPCSSGDPADFHCPYPLPEIAAKKLVAGDGTTANPKQLEQLFVLGMSVSDTAVATLNKIADAGKTTKALQADDPNTLRSTLDAVFSPLLNPISRSVPAFATGLSGIQYQISSGFQVTSKSLSATTAPPWTGIIERRSYICNQTTGGLDSPDLTDADRFQKVINAQSQSKRKLKTSLPVTTVSQTVMQGSLYRIGTNAPCGSSYCTDTDITQSTVTPALFGTGYTAADKQKVTDWMYGVTGSARDGRRLGDVYHSSPAVVGPPTDYPGDDSYQYFRDTPAVKERPLVMYINTNDGILHAINVEDFPVTGYPLTVHAADVTPPIKAGEELWGFVPPMLIPVLKDQLAQHQFNFDGTPVIKDVFYKRETAAVDTKYHTVLITGMRAGSPDKIHGGYVALDVTDPFAPQFLWQFTNPHMGLTYGQPEIVQATFKWAANSTDTPTVQTRAVAILSGGVGAKRALVSTAPGCVLGTAPAMRKSGSLYKSWVTDDGSTEIDHRSGTQCWETVGRSLFFVDVETGILIKEVFDDDGYTAPAAGQNAPTWSIASTANGIFFPSPIVGTPTAYQDTVSTIADRGYVMDADGLMWRIDMSSQDPVPSKASDGWTLRPFHDLFLDKKPTSADETTYERPILTVDDKKRVVVLVGTGNTDNFTNSTADNRIVSLTEVSRKDTPTAPDDYQALVNWALVNEGTSGNGLVPSELVTGAMALFEGQLFAATFISDTGSGDACEYGRGRAWSLSYNQRDKDHQNPSGETVNAKTFSPLRIPVPVESGFDTDAALFNIPVSQAQTNLIIQGLGATQRNACLAAETDPLSSYFAPKLANIQSTATPAIWIVAQASGGTQRAASSLGGVQAKINRPITFSRVTSWATSVD